MTFLPNAPEPSDAGTIAKVIFVVLAISGALGFFAWRWLKSVEKTLADPRRMRRRMLFSAGLYGFGAIYAISQVVLGQAPLRSLIGLPIGVLFLWVFLQAAANPKVPPTK